MFRSAKYRVTCAALLLPALMILAQLPTADLKKLPLHRLEERIAAIDSELGQLSTFSPRGGVGAIGFRSAIYSTADNKEWIVIKLEKEELIDEVVLVPTICRNTAQGYQADACPSAFRIRAGTAGDETGAVVAQVTSDDAILPRIAPLVIPISPTKATWVRIEATQLTLRAFDSRYVLQLAEILLFSGTENVALRCAVETSSNIRDNAGAWDKKFLTDGFMPYLMNSTLGSQSKAYVSIVGEKPGLIIDLGREFPLSRIHLHAVDQSDTVPQAYAGDLGIPRHLKIEGANRLDFSEAEKLLEYEKASINDTGPIMMWRIPEKTCRYVRVADVDSETSRDADSYNFRIGFAEIELFSKGINVALNKPIVGDEKLKTASRTPVALTDGNNSYGQILPVRVWMEELARRHDLETLRPLLAKELARRYTRQSVVLTRMRWLALLLAAAVVIYLLINHNLQTRRITRIKDRFAADLHDELGANIHTIGLLGDLAKEAADSPDELIELLDRLREFTERSGAAVRYCTNMLEAKSLCEDLVEEMRRSSSRMLADLEHELSFEGEEILHLLKPRKRIDLFFFYKECLNNIIRHSGATKVSTRLVADRKGIVLSITDNGHGLEHLAAGDGIPASLKRRARLMGARVTAEHPADGGTRITLHLRTKRWRT
jgi:signal transduction histidine kinase